MFTTHIFMCLIIHIKPMLSIGIFYELLHSTSPIYLKKRKKTRITVNPGALYST